MKFLKSKIAKRILGFFLIMGCSGVFFNGYVGVGEPAHAQVITAAGNGNQGGSVIDTMSIWQILNMVLKVIYLLLWPLLVIAGLALDNTLVYASVFHLDAPLWKFWNMMKNFANFALGFMVLYAIIKNLLTNGDEKSPLKIIKTTLVAGILIQASRFIVAALVDVSTIATYAVGGLPLSVLKNTDIGKQKILTVNSSINLNKFQVTSPGGEDFQVWYSTEYPGIQGTDKKVTISPCRVENSYVVGREYGNAQYKNSAKLTTIPDYKGLELCILFSNKLVMRQEDALMQKLQAEMPKPDPGYGDNVGYSYYMNRLLNKTGWDNQPEYTQYLVYLGSGDKVFATGDEFFGGTNSMTMSDLITKSKGFVGPLVTIYSSLLNFSQLTNASVTTTSGTSGVFIIKALVAIALFFPLIALALVLIARIGILWLYIVASPFIILKESFKDFLPLKGLDEYLKLPQIIGTIFAPVITVAALSISLIFMTALVNGFSSPATHEDINQSLGIQEIAPINAPGEDAFSIGGIAQFQFSKLPWGEAMDRFSRLMVNFFAIGLMRMIFFASLKASKVGASLGGEVEKFGSNIFKSLPILPFEGGKVGLGSAYKVLKGAPHAWVDNRISNQNRIADDFVFPKNNSEGPTGTSTPPVTFLPEQATTIATNLGGGKELKEAITVAGITAPPTLTTLGTQENLTAIYNAINTMKGTDTEKETAKISAVGLFGNDRYKNETARLASIKITTDIIIPTIKESTTENEIQNLLDNDKNKTTLKQYFDNTNAPYTTTVGSKKLTITRTTKDNVDTYTPKFETTPSK